MINPIIAKNELLNNYHNLIVIKLNSFCKNNKSFSLKDLIPEKQYNYYYIHITKGILLSYINLNFINIESTLTGCKSFRYSVNKLISEKNL